MKPAAPYLARTEYTSGSHHYRTFEAEEDANEYALERARWDNVRRVAVYETLYTLDHDPHHGGPQ